MKTLILTHASSIIECFPFADHQLRLWGNKEKKLILGTRSVQFNGGSKHVKSKTITAQYGRLYAQSAAGCPGEEVSCCQRKLELHGEGNL